MSAVGIPFLQEGEDVKHKITAKVQTTLGDSLEGEGYIKVADL